jgi:4-diphosphocytidyl-2-C-methyl-D-erythritol kinase
MEVRTARIRSLAKINLDLRVLHKRPDGFHELRTIFQTISLSDSLRISFEPKRRTEIRVAGNVEIPGNIVIAAAERVMEAGKVRGLVTFDLQKSIPMGGGLGGGSSNAAAVLLALPVLMGRRVPLLKLEEIAGTLGSDVTFFLQGGTALGLGRGTDLYPLPDIPKQRGWLVAPGVHVSTADAYRGLNRALIANCPGEPADFRSNAWLLESGDFRNCRNDFEASVYSQHMKLKRIHSKLQKAGANVVRMSGSGSSIFAFFSGPLPDRSILESCTVHEIETVSRRQFRSLWWRQLREHTAKEIWPPLNRYVQ